LVATPADAAGVDNTGGVAGATANRYAHTAPCRYPCAACEAVSAARLLFLSIIVVGIVELRIVEG
jgi:hypothetical protein